YIDTDGVAGSGSTEALAGRRVRIAEDSAWEYAVWVEGWNQALFSADGTALPARVRAVTDPIHRRVTIQVPKAAIGAPQPHWGYVVLILGQEGFPASDSLRVREVVRVAQEWRFGGGHDGPFDPNVIDMLAPAGQQERQLSGYDADAGVLAEIRAVSADGPLCKVAGTVRSGFGALPTDGTHAGPSAERRSAAAGPAGGRTVRSGGPDRFAAAAAVPSREESREGDDGHGGT